MSSNPPSTVYVGNLDEKVSDRVLYDILVEAGRVVNLHIPRDKKTDRPKGYAFAEYESEEVANYAVSLFSGLVTLYKRTLKFGNSGQDKPSTNVPTLGCSTSTSKARPKPVVSFNNIDFSPQSPRLSTPCRFSANNLNHYAEVPVPPGVLNQPNGYNLHFDNNNNNNHDYSQRVFGTTFQNITRTRSSRYDMSNPINYAHY